MTKILVEESVLRQALGALNKEYLDAKTEKVEPVAWGIFFADNHSLNEMFFKEKDARDEAAEYSNPRGVYVSPLYVAPTPPTNTTIHRYTGTGEGPPPVEVPSGGMVIIKEAKPEKYVAASFEPVDAKHMYNTEMAHDELREAARAVVEWSSESLEKRIDRLRKALR